MIMMMDITSFTAVAPSSLDLIVWLLRRNITDIDEIPLSVRIVLNSIERNEEFKSLYQEGDPGNG